MEINLPNHDRDKVKKLKEQLLKDVYQDQEFKEFINYYELPVELVQKNLSKFLNVIEDRKLCTNCPGVDKCTKKMGNLQISITYDEDYDRIENSVKTCPCARNREKLKKNFIIADFNEKILDSSFAESKRYFSKEREPLVKYCTLDFKTELLNNGSPKGVFLVGDSKVGKTHLMVLLAKLIANNTSKKIAYVDCLSYIDTLNNLLYREKDTFQEKLKELKEVDVLVLDDFGSEFKNDYIRDQIILPLLTYRASKNLITCFTSSYTIHEIQDMYCLKKADAPKAKRLIEAINKLTIMFELRGMAFPE